MNNISLDETISRSASLLNQVGHEVNSMLTLIQEEFNQRSSEEEKRYWKEWKEVSQWSSSEWLFNAHATYIPVKAKGKGNKPDVRYLSVQVSLAGDTISGDGFINQAPLIHVSYFDSPPDFDNIYYVGYPFDNAWRVTLDSEVVWFRAENDVNHHDYTWDKTEWLFSVQLTSVNTLDDIRDKIVNPVFMLLDDSLNGVTKLAGIEGVIHYKKVDDKNYQLIPYKPDNQTD